MTLRPCSDPERGLFISVDGPSGAGKSTIVRHLAQMLVAAGEDVHVTAEPSNGPIGKLCRELTETVTGHALACLYAADRYHHVKTEIHQRRDAGKVVISDRYLASGLVMQRFDDIDLNYLWQLNSRADQPDLVVILEADPEVIAGTPCRARAAQPLLVEVLLLVAIIAIDRGHIDRRSAAGRALSLVLVAVLVADAAGVTARLIADLIQGGPETNSAADLLKTGFLVWLYTIIAFAFVYWTLDGGGPESRFLAPLEFPNLAFPAQLNPGTARPGWRPEFFDYLYLGFTNATAFSPTDVMPLARWGKLAMTVQAVCSLMILGLVIARAANILQ